MRATKTILLSILLVIMGISFAVADNSIYQSSYPSPLSKTTTSTTERLNFEPTSKNNFISYCSDTANDSETLALSALGELMLCDYARNVITPTGVWSTDIALGHVYLSDLTQNVGINTSTPTAKLHVYDGSFLAEGVYGDLPSTGTGTRLMWSPQKSAFRAGTANTEWDDANVGSFSAVLGGSVNMASGEASVILGGQNNITTGTPNIDTGAAVAGGINNKAGGNYSVTIAGDSSVVSGDHSLAFNSPDINITGDNITSVGVPPTGANKTISLDDTTVIWGDPVGINTIAPLGDLGIQGIFHFGNPNQKRFAVGAGTADYVITGTVAADGTLTQASSTGANISITKVNPTFPELYSIVYNVGYLTNPSVKIVPVSTLTLVPVVAWNSTGSTTVRFWDTQANQYVDSGFTFFLAGTIDNTLTLDMGPLPPPPPFCGDGICNGGEGCGDCSQDCGVCIGGGGGIPGGGSPPAGDGDDELKDKEFTPLMDG